MTSASQDNTFYGKYRADVVDNDDPLHIARLTLHVPDVLGATATGWALPCLPFTADQAGVFVLPPIGANVWAEFEQGDPSFPIWTGGWWSHADDLPDAARQADPRQRQDIVVQTTGGNLLLISDEPGTSGGVILRSAAGTSITVNDSGIYLTNGEAKLTLEGATVDLNDSALTVA